MTEYNYLYAMTKDIIDYIEENIGLGEYDTLEELEEHLNEILWTEDSVTGTLLEATLSALGKQKNIFAIISTFSPMPCKNSVVVWITSLKKGQKPPT